MPRHIARAVESLCTDEAIRRPEAWLATVAQQEEDASLFSFALAHAQHCRGISGCTTRLLVECASAEALEAVAAANEANDVGVPIAAMLPDDAELWQLARKLDGTKEAT